MAYDRGANRSGGAAAYADLPLDKEPRKAALPLAEGGFCRSRHGEGLITRMPSLSDLSE